MCVPLRVPVQSFQPSKSQRRACRRNGDLSVGVDLPQATEEKFDLYRRYTTGWHGKPPAEDGGEDAEGGWETFESFLYDSPVDTVEFCYRDAAGRLLGVGICDICPESLSSVYFYFDPVEARRSLGTFGAVYEIEFARSQGIPNYYLGYWVSGCGAMQYKANFRPCEILHTDGVWRPLDDRPGAGGNLAVASDAPHAAGRS